ncbi:MAG TPA: polysaccharide deacetylase family protein [Bacillota bacterium]|nr:polysaccharide deacetylase family protein [Bacillota bacterium]
MGIVFTGILICFGLWVIIYPGTDYYNRWYYRDVIRRGNTNGKLIHLSFDDGPDPRYTPDVLRILNQFRIPASFFLVGKKVECHPELARQICLTGHEIGSHTYYHQHAYWLFFKKSKETVEKNRVLLSSIMGAPLIWFRPPWGAMNLFEWFVIKRENLRPVLWTANANDWLTKTKPEMIQSLLVKKVHSGSIILLHDSGGEPGAPLNTLKALPGIIRKFQAEGYRFVSLQEITGGKGQ